MVAPAEKKGGICSFSDDITLSVNSHLQQIINKLTKKGTLGSKGRWMNLKSKNFITENLRGWKEFIPP